MFVACGHSVEGGGHWASLPAGNCPVYCLGTLGRGPGFCLTMESLESVFGGAVHSPFGSLCIGASSFLMLGLGLGFIKRAMNIDTPQTMHSRICTKT